jgi:hypothetical protein
MGRTSQIAVLASLLSLNLASAQGHTLSWNCGEYNQPHQAISASQCEETYARLFRQMNCGAGDTVSCEAQEVNTGVWVSPDDTKGSKSRKTQTSHGQNDASEQAYNHQSGITHKAPAGDKHADDGKKKFAHYEIADSTLSAAARSSLREKGYQLFGRTKTVTRCRAEATHCSRANMKNAKKGRECASGGSLQRVGQTELYVCRSEVTSAPSGGSPSDDSAGSGAGH